MKIVRLPVLIWNLMYRGLSGVKIFILKCTKKILPPAIKHFVHIKFSHELLHSSNFSERASKNNRVAVTNSNSQIMSWSCVQKFVFTDSLNLPCRYQIKVISWKITGLYEIAPCTKLPDSPLLRKNFSTYNINTFVKIIILSCKTSTDCKNPKDYHTL